MSLDIEFLEKIAVRQHEWRHARLGSFNRVDLKYLKRSDNQSEPLELSYDVRDDSWKAKLGGKDVSENLDLLKANFLMGVVEGLEVTNWLSEEDEEAKSALQNPLMTFEIKQRLVDEFGDETGEVTEVIVFGSNKTTGKIFGKKSSENLFFSISDETVLKLSIPLLDE